MRGRIAQSFKSFAIIVTIVGTRGGVRKIVMVRAIQILVVRQSFPAAVKCLVGRLVVDRGVGVCPDGGGSLSEVAFFRNLALLTMVAGPTTITLWSVSKYMGF